MRLKLEKDAVNMITWMYDLLRTKETETTTLHPYFFLARPAVCGLYVLLLFLTYLFLTITVSPVISKSTKPIFATFCGLVKL